MLTDKNPRDLVYGERTNKCRRMRHQCDRDGCFETQYRCQLGMLDRWFPGHNGLSDIDGFAEIDGRFLFLEWKRPGAPFAGKQKDALTELSSHGLVVVGWGDARYMLPESFAYALDGEWTAAEKDAGRKFDELLDQWSHNFIEGWQGHDGPATN